MVRSILLQGAAMTDSTDHRVETAARKRAQTRDRLLRAMTGVLKERPAVVTNTDIRRYSYASQSTSHKYFGSVDNLIYQAVMPLYVQIYEAALPSQDVAPLNKLREWLLLLHSEDMLPVMTAACHFDDAFTRVNDAGLKNALASNLHDILQQCAKEHSTDWKVSTLRLASKTIDTLLEEIVRNDTREESHLSHYYRLSKIVAPMVASSI